MQKTISLKKHQKHSKLEKRTFGNYAPHEISILGAPCQVISDLVINVSKLFKAKYQIAYLDASHSESSKNAPIDSFVYHHLGGLESECSQMINPYRTKNQLSAYDLTFINGNHFSGESQIIIIDKEKENSISKRIDQINNVVAFVYKDDIEIFDVLKNKFPSFKDIPAFKLDEVAQLSILIEAIVKSKIPKLNGLVLAGGQSTRMGKDKGSLKYYGKEHSLYLQDLLKPLVNQNYLSLKQNTEKNQNIIEDRFYDLGPFGAICSAFMHKPNEAFLVLATDLPYIDKDFLEDLINKRDSSKLATAVIGEDNKFPEPLICIWEPKAYPVLMQYLSQGISCPRKVLINEGVKCIRVKEKYITNVNENLEYINVLKELK